MEKVEPDQLRDTENEGQTTIYSIYVSASLQGRHQTINRFELLLVQFCINSVTSISS